VHSNNLNRNRNRSHRWRSQPAHFEEQRMQPGSWSKYVFGYSRQSESQSGRLLTLQQGQLWPDSQICNATKLHRILRRLPASGANWRLLAAFSRMF